LIDRRVYNSSIHIQLYDETKRGDLELIIEVEPWKSLLSLNTSSADSINVGKRRLLQMS